MISIFAVLAFWLIFSFAGTYVSNAKRRSPWEGAILAFCFGPIGILVAALLPTASPRREKRRPTVEHYGWKPMDKAEDEVDEWLK